LQWQIFGSCSDRSPSPIFAPRREVSINADRTKQSVTKRRARSAPSSFRKHPANIARLPHRRPGHGALLILQPLAGFVGAALQFFLQLLLLFLEDLRIGRRTVIGLGEIAEWQHEADRLALAVDALDHQTLPLLELADQLPARLVVGHAAVVEADHVG